MYEGRENQVGFLEAWMEPQIIFSAMPQKSLQNQQQLRIFLNNKEISWP
jgi:hypothetical protein